MLYHHDPPGCLRGQGHVLRNLVLLFFGLSTYKSISPEYVDEFK